MSKSKEYDLVIVGAGIVGLMAATQMSDQFDNILVVERTERPKAWIASDEFDLRVSALNLASVELLAANGVWQNILDKRAFPFRSMCVWDDRFGGEINFRASDTCHAQLGFIVENDLIRDALLQRCNEIANIELQYECMPVELTQFSDGILLQTSQGDRIMAKLLLATDGRLSHTRCLAEIEVDTVSYQQSGLVAVCETELAHQDTAWQCFTHHGPLAMLPLAENVCSMVWSMSSAQALHFKQLETTELEKEIAQPLRNFLGGVQLRSRIASFDLQGMQARQYVKDHVVLLGDAAHQVHPLAGQGLNLGLADVTCLSKVLLDTKRSKGSERVLRRYERERKAENKVMQTSFEWIDRLFREQSEVAGIARSSGFKLLDKIPFAKRIFMQKAIGLPL